MNNLKNTPIYSALKICSAIALSCAFLSPSALAGHSASAGVSVSSTAPTHHNTDRIIIKYKNTSPLSTATTLSATTLNQMSQVAGTKLHHLHHMANGAQVLQLDGHKNAAQISQIISALQTDSNVEYAEPDLILQALFTPNDSRYNEQWQYFEAAGGLNLPLAWDITQGQGSVVAVLDTGYRPHQDLAANIIAGYDMISSTTIAQDGDGRDADASDPGDWAPADACATGSAASNSSWHGTHVAGSIAAVTNNNTGVAGVAFNAKILPIRVLGRCGGFTSDIADAIIWAAGGNVSGVPNNPNPADVINLSLGGTGNCATTTQSAINTARNLGATIVVAAGNANTNASSSTPANCQGVVTVAATNRNGGKTSYSNFGSVVDVAAPGGSARTGIAGAILSTLNSGTRAPANDSYRFYQGTSMATPHVAGAAALLYAVNPAITPTEVESILKSTARTFPATCNQCGSGIVDALAAVNAAGGTSTNPTPPPAAPPSAPPSDNTLQNAIALTELNATRSTDLNFTIEVPAGANRLNFQISGGLGDADLYVRLGSAPTTRAYDCRPYINGSNENCPINNAQPGTYHVMLRAYADFSGVSLLASFNENTAPPANPVQGTSLDESNLSANRGTWQHYTVEVPAGAPSLTANISGGNGDADLYVRFNAPPTLSSYNCRPYRPGNTENCNIATPQAGTWHISVRGYATYSGVNLSAQSAP